MPEPNLTESAWQRAKVDAGGVYRTTTFQLGGALVAAIFSALALIAQKGQPTSTQVAVLVLAAAVAILLSVIVVLVCQFAAAPVRQRNELREAWTSPSENQPTDIAVRLWNAYRKGCDLSARMEGQLAHERDWHAVEKWAEETANLLAGNVPEELAREFFSAGSYETDLVRQLDDRTGELQKIIKGLG